RIDGAVAAVRRKRNDEARAEWLAGSTPSGIGHRPGYVDQGVLAHHLRSTVGPQSVVTNDAGSFSAWVTRYLTREQPRTYLAPTSGAMGYAIPAAIAAGLANPGDAPVAIVGDGGFMMTGSEIQTAVRERVPIKVIVVDNSQYGTIRLHQERVTRGAYPGSSLGSIDFAGYARSLGANGFTVSEDSQVALTLEKALGCPGPAVVHVVVDPTQLEIEDV
ncbi:MAG: thiamine pyrophosphate-dependent enzyme, partial [Acidimicrobiia bacterium]